MLRRRTTSELAAVLAFAVFGSGASAASPRLPIDGFRLEQVAAEPEIVTPVGMAFDHAGRLLVVESNTHERPKDYEGPGSDRIRMFSDSDGDGRLDRWSTFAEGFEFAMAVLPRADGALYVVTRSALVLLKDTNNDGVADERHDLLRLETEDHYPHNGLVGIAATADGKLLVSMGENHGMAFHLIGADGQELHGEGEGGTIFGCDSEGNGLARVAVGFWNPFSLCALPDGRIFTADNDPDASPPCRLLHVVPGGDYGFRFRYGRAGTHPLQAWNGELPGTLPMICGVGEAPTATIAHTGRIWVTSWGDHRIERYRLIPRGASYSAEREVVVQGDTDFRPTGMAVAPDGSLYFGDWVLRNYPVHGHGRIWRLTLPTDDISEAFPEKAAKMQDAETSLASDDPFVRVAGVRMLAAHDESEMSAAAKSVDAKVRLGRLEALKLRGSDQAESILREALADPSSDVRLFALRWTADERLITLRENVANLLNQPLPNSKFYLAVLATLDWLDNEPKIRNAGITDALLIRELENESRSTALQAVALGQLSPDDKFLSLDRLRQYLASPDETLRLAAIRTLSQRTNTDRFPLLAEVVRDGDQRDAVRVEAIAGLAAAPADDEYRRILTTFSTSNDAVLAREALRALRLLKLQPVPNENKPSPSDLAAWNDLLSEPGDAESGRRLFFSAVGARCSVCHQYDGRGGTIGPDLSHISRNTSRERVIASILQPSQEIAPAFQPWTLITTDGKTLAGLRSAKSGDDGNEIYVDSAGQSFALPSDKIEFRAASTTSIMPDGLETAISIADLRDLVTFLTDSNSE